MNEILINATTILVLLAGLAALVVWTRADVYAGPGVGHRAKDPIGPGSPDADPNLNPNLDGDLPQRTLNRIGTEVRPAPYESHPTTLTA